MFVGQKRHYVIEEIRGRHFLQTAERAGISPVIAQEALQEIAGRAGAAILAVEKQLPPDFPGHIHTSVVKGLKKRLPALSPD